MNAEKITRNNSIQRLHGNAEKRDEKIRTEEIFDGREKKYSKYIE